MGRDGEAKEDVVGEVNSWHGGGGSGREKIAKQKTGSRVIGKKKLATFRAVDR